MTPSDISVRVRASHNSSVVAASPIQMSQVLQIISDGITVPIFGKLNTTVSMFSHLYCFIAVVCLFNRNGPKPQSLPSLKPGFPLLQPFVLLLKTTPAGIFSHNAIKIANTLLGLRLKIDPSVSIMQQKLFFSRFLFMADWVCLLK